ncbi:hypothetical protein [Spongiactinospora sp. TRM90649]|uniref:hypothetical protein n=1 Tax=Spongiactinospora sp. TRM90649 TaxID=3031114 RepID=UPI0023F6BAAA|nr:hypothetical protein [Spongiactinospora sp. TRM90649]MDF5751911.1 hypothetical protein [Spongiactinospora sp. TRM90649]
MSERREAPAHVRGLAEQRAKARADRDFASADVLRGQIEQAGWLVRDGGPEGFELAPKPPFEVWPTVAAIPVPAARERLEPVEEPDGPEKGGEPTEASGPGTEGVVAAQVLWDASLATSRVDEAISGAGGSERYTKTPSGTVTVGLLVDGWPGDVRRCLDALLTYTDAKIIALDLGDIDGAGTVLHELADAHGSRITAFHVAERPHWRSGSAGWGASRTKLMRIDTAEIHVMMETSTVLDGDAITPLADAIHAGATAAGWQGVDPGDDGREWHPAGPGRVRGLLGYLLAVRRAAALDAGGLSDRARYYRNADLEFSLTLPGDLVVPEGTLPVHQERHRAYHEVDPAYRDRESHRTYDRVLRLLRSKPGARTP